MIGSLRGTVADWTVAGSILVDVGGVGYEVQTTPACAAACGGVGAEVLLSIHTHVREDAIVLYGFASGAQKRSFELLLSAHGVGPSLALSVLSTLEVDALHRAIEDEDLGVLSQVPGVGRKTAQRLVLDLKGRIDAGVEPMTSPRAGQVDEARMALEALGFSSVEIDAALLAAGEGSTETIVRSALRALASRS